MDIKNLLKLYKSNYSDSQYRSVGGKATNFYHRMLETKLSNKHFSKVLEVGAGSGEHLEFINHGFETLVISDLTLPIPPGHILDKVKQHTDNGRIIEFKSENVENLSYSNSEFDRVIATCLLHHVEKPHDALLEIRRVTKNGGCVSLYLPTDPGFFYRLAQYLVTTRALKKYSIKEINYLRAYEHRNHFSSINGMIEGVFADDLITKNSFPKINFGWNTTFFKIYTIKIRKFFNEGSETHG